MVKVLVNGGLFEISKVEEIVEKRVPFNGTNIRLVQIAKDSKQAVSGLHFQVKNTECNVFAIGEFTIGNLPTAKVKEIMKQLLSDGYYDFSDCDFQPMMFVEKYKFDEGKSKPYFCQGSLIQFYAPNDVFNCPLNINGAEVQAEFGDEKDDLSDMSDEELRQAIYELEDTTMLRLGQMSREEADLSDMELVETPAKDIDEKSKDSNKKTTKSKPVVDKEVTETTEVSANPEATKDTAEVANTDVSSTNGVSSEAAADASSDTSVATNEDSASDSSEADADPAKDVADGTEDVA